MQGDATAAARVKDLRRPSVAAWAVDAVARTHAEELDALIRAGEDLAVAQRAMTAGSGADRLREATEERRRSMDGLIRAAAKALDEAGMSSARVTLDKVTDTLTAIASNPDAAELVRRGVLDRELQAPAGFGDVRLDAAPLASVTTLPQTRRSAASPADDGPARVRKEEERRRRADHLAALAGDLEGEADRLEREARVAESAAAQARKDAEVARRRAQAARRKADKASS